MFVFREKMASTPPGYPGGENLWAVTLRLIAGEETLDFRLLLGQLPTEYIAFSLLVVHNNSQRIWVKYAKTATGFTLWQKASYIYFSYISFRSCDKVQSPSVGESMVKTTWTRLELNHLASILNILKRTMVVSIYLEDKIVWHIN